MKKNIEEKKQNICIENTQFKSAINNNHTKTIIEENKVSLIKNLNQIFEWLKSDDFYISNDNFVNHQLNMNYNLKCIILGEKHPKEKSLLKLSNNYFVSYNEREIYILDTNLDKELASKKFESDISCISELKSNIKNISLIVSLKEENPFILELNTEYFVIILREMKANIKSANIFLEIVKKNI